MLLIVVLCWVLGSIAAYKIGYEDGHEKTETVVVEKEVVKEVIKFVTIEAPETTVAETTSDPEPEIKSLGVFTATAYCCENYPHICNDGDSTYTATGTTPTEGRTIAVDPRVIPYGTEVLINGQTYIAEDTGGAIKGNRIDICFTKHADALEFGKRQVEVFIINES